MLCLSNVTYTYPHATEPAVRDLSLRVRPGEAVLCTGPSGCGKSTLIRLTNGLCPHYYRGRLEGDVTAGGQRTAETPLHELARMVGTLFQDPENQFFALTVGDEIAFAHEWRGSEPARTLAAVDEAARRFGIAHLLDQPIHDLSEGQKQKVALASILSLGPRAVVLDEPTANLDPEATLALADEIRVLKAAGMAVLIVDHRLYWLEGVVDRVVVMADGRIVEEGDFSILHDDALRAARGLRAARVADPRTALPDASGRGDALCVADLRYAHKHGPELYHGASFLLPRGVIGVLGDNGTGKTTLARLLTGLHRMHSGRLHLHGVPVRPDRMLRHGSIVLQNTDHQLHMKSVREEIAASIIAGGAGNAPPPATHPAQRGTRDDQPALPDLDALLDLFNLAHLADRHPQSLSGGEKQRLVIACGMAKQPEVLILDEPTSGLDGHNMRLVADAVRAAAARGAVVLLVSHDLELLSITCDAALRLPLRGSHIPKENPRCSTIS